MVFGICSGYGIHTDGVWDLVWVWVTILMVFGIWSGYG